MSADLKTVRGQKFYSHFTLIPSPYNLHGGSKNSQCRGTQKISLETGNFSPYNLRGVAWETAAQNTLDLLATFPTTMTAHVNCMGKSSQFFQSKIFTLEKLNRVLSEDTQNFVPDTGVCKPQVAGHPKALKCR